MSYHIVSFADCQPTSCWDTYYYSYLQVVHGLTITTSGYVLNSFSLMSSFLGPFIGM